MKQIASFAWWQAFGGIGYLAQHQCQAIIVNKYFGPTVNAAYSVSVTVGGEAAALTGALNGAFAPAVTTAYGEGNQYRMKKLAYGASKFGTFLTMIFAIPICLEISQILRIWLKKPAYSESLCLCWLIVTVIEKLSLGHGQATQAVGKVGWFQFFRGLSCFMAIPFSIFAIMIYNRPYMVGCALILTTILACISDIYVSGFYTGLSVKYWLYRIVLPLLGVLLIGLMCGFCVKRVMCESFLRLVVVTLISLSALCVSAWSFLLDYEEKSFLIMYIRRKLKKVENNE